MADIEHESTDTSATASSRRRGFTWENDDTHLRKVELGVLIPKKVREKSRDECKEFVDAFTVCCAASGVSMLYKCRKENSELRECLTKYYKDQDLFDKCKQEYLQERKEFRDTGIRKKDRDKMSASNDQAT